MTLGETREFFVGSFVSLMLCALFFFYGFPERPGLVAICVFFVVFDCDAMCMVFLMVLAGRPPFAAICVDC